MLRSVKELRGYAIQAMDGRLGKVDGFFFDDLTWTVRYLVADTDWLFDRLVLLSPVSLGQPDWKKHIFPVRLTKEQVEHSPPVIVDRPVSQQMEEKVVGYYGWPTYWTGATASVVADAIARTEKVTLERGNPHLRSTQKVIGYHIRATDGEIGHLEDFIVEDSSWIIRYLVVNTHNLLRGKSVLVSPAWVNRVSWVEREVYVDLAQETIKNSPEFDPAAPVNRAYELRLYDYYGRPRYWTRVEH